MEATMPVPSAINADADWVDYVLFEVGDLLCGMDILAVQEIKKLVNITPVHKASAYVRGVVNMRGQIVTLIDIRQRLGMAKSEARRSFLTIIVPHKNELIGVLVQSVEDIVRAPRDAIDTPPSNMHGVKRQFISGILKRDGALVAIINKDALVSVANTDLPLRP
jgi:purine-binding chemotaxis protein CheW